MKRTWILGAAVLAGALSLGVPQARAAQFGIYVGAPAAYMPPCPGPGYEWAAGYWSDGYWVPGRWNYVGVRVGYNPYVHYDHQRSWRDDRSFDRDHDRGWHNGDRGGDHFRH